jgi:hypothetical protein
MITQRDKDIINLVDTIGFSSIKNISDMFFTNTRYGYDLARKRLKKIEESGKYVKSFRNSDTNEIVYVPFNSRLKNISIHNIKVLEYICKLKCLGCEMKTTEIEPIFDCIKPDAYISFVFNGYLYHQLLEVQIRHDYIDLKRFKGDSVINAILDKTKNCMPRIIIVQNTSRDYQKENDTKFKITQLGIGMEDVAKVLV